MISVDIKWKGAKQAQKTLNRLRTQFPKAVRRANRMEADDLLAATLPHVPRASGRLAESGHVRQSRDSGGRFGSRWQVVFDAPHALYVHEGIKGGFMPPIEPFRQWAGAKLGDEKLAFVVARSVGERGLQPNKFLTNTAQSRERGRAKRMISRVRKSI